MLKHILMTRYDNKFHENVALSINTDASKNQSERIEAANSQLQKTVAVS